MPEPEVVVVGSANLDLVLQVETIPAPGETVLSRALERGAGGKGLNQAVAAARAGATTAFVGAVGGDDAGDLLLGALTEAGVDAAGVTVVGGASGTAVVVVDGRGENAIVVAPGANDLVVGLSDAQLAQVQSARVLVLQLEIPVATVTEAARAAHDAGRLVVLNAAPAQPLPPELLAAVDLLVVNRGEAELLAGAADGSTVDELLATLVRSVPAVVITLGAEGSVYADRSGVRHDVAAVPVEVVDTTGAGDTFTGALAACLAQGEPVLGALRFAGAAAATAVTSAGAVSAIPHRAEVERVLAVAEAPA